MCKDFVCRGCAHYYNALSQCRKNPPTVIYGKGAYPRPPMTVWPTPNATDWCGSWKKQYRNV